MKRVMDLFKKKTPRQMQAPEPRQQYFPPVSIQETHPENWEKTLQKKGIELGLLQYHNLIKGHAVYAHVPEEDRSAWLKLTNLHIPYRDVEIKLFGPQFDYSLAQAVRQLSLVHADKDIAATVEQALQKGVSVDLDIYHKEKKMTVLLTADPAIRSVAVTNTLGAPLPMRELNLTVTQPLRADHYAVYEQGNLSYSGQDYFRAEQLVKDQLDWYALNQESRELKVVGVTGQAASHLGNAGDPMDAQTQLVLTGSCTADPFLPGVIKVERHIRPADIATAEEASLRHALRNHPFITPGEYNRLSQEASQRLPPQRQQEVNQQSDRPAKNKRLHL